MLSESPEIFWSVDDIVFFIIGICKCGPSEIPWPLPQALFIQKGLKKRRKMHLKCLTSVVFFKRHLKLAAKVFSILLSWHKMSKQTFFLKLSVLPTIETTHGKFQCRIYFTKHTVTRD